MAGCGDKIECNPHARLGSSLSLIAQRTDAACPALTLPSHVARLTGSGSNGGYVVFFYFYFFYFFPSRARGRYTHDCPMQPGILLNRRLKGHKEENSTVLLSLRNGRVIVKTEHKMLAKKE